MSVRFMKRWRREGGNPVLTVAEGSVSLKKEYVMKKLLTLALAVAFVATAAQADMVMYEDFESYTVDATIHLQGADGTVPRWHTQDNTTALWDHLSSNVRSSGGNQYLQMVANNRFGVQSMGAMTAMAMESMEITGEGTIYLRFAVNDVSSNIIATNDLNPGWDYDSNAQNDPGTVNADGWQQGGLGRGYSDMGALYGIGGGEPFKAYNWGTSTPKGYDYDTNINPPIQKWMELWIQVDHDNDRTKYFICEQGGTPVQAMSTFGEWWYMRNDTHINNAVQNLKFVVSNYSYSDETSNTLLVDTIGINTSAMTLERVGDEILPNPYDSAPPCPGDADLDGDVDIDDFVALKANFGSGTTWVQGDFDGDGDVDIDDFVILKGNFGSSCE